ncbi:hypothetical protein [Chitinophaga sancti]|uniref:Uncharacterized protein n=1 Tax=Chitinophaga sancti TaxID=1004 RepID=A0A1K1MWT0_9BACT|nr:hypothetical protein [Chitinophaga sancti]WQD63061.1 hypothetical protein U0033_01545 [Chitinophaga sancti]WQG91314.1 hypothetical protein SR876_07370 [Chitinophaga sancti]SFW27616.1 hypothetical protein SAMN05661012_00966 [Chitinophaga sancti]
MEMQDDFESLLKGAAGNFGQESLSEQALSEMIDDRLMESRNRLRAEFRKEIMLIVVTLVSIIYLLVQLYRHPHQYRPQFYDSLRVAILGGVVYLVGSFVLFLRLVQVAKTQKDMGVRGYIKGIYTKTERALLTYLWVSTIASTGTLATVLAWNPKLGWYWMVIGIFLMGVGMYYLNKIYTDKRFGKRLREMKGLLEEFE